MISGASEDENDTKANVIRRAMAAMNTTPERTLMIGDTRFDAEGAQLAGTDFLGALYGYGTREEMEAFGAVYVYLFAGRAGALDSGRLIVFGIIPGAFSA